MLTNNQMKLIAKLKTARGRKKSDAYLCEGKRSCLEAVAKCPELIQFAVVVEDNNDLTEENSFPVYRVAEKTFNELSSTATPQGIMLVLSEPNEAPELVSLKDQVVIVLDRVTDPGNFGTIIRSAWAAGLTEIWYTAGTTDPFGTKAVRSGMGAHFSLNFRKFADLAEVEDKMAVYDGKLLLTKPLAENSCYSEAVRYRGNAIVMGNEANGIEYCSEQATEITIPMPGNAESLNVATAATIVIFEYVRRIS